MITSRILIVSKSEYIAGCNGFNGFNGNCIGFNGNYNGVWYVMDSIGGMLNPIGKMKKEFCNGILGKSNGSL